MLVPTNIFPRCSHRRSNRPCTFTRVLQNTWWNEQKIHEIMKNKTKTVWMHKYTLRLKDYYYYILLQNNIHVCKTYVQCIHSIEMNYSLDDLSCLLNQRLDFNHLLYTDYMVLLSPSMLTRSLKCLWGVCLTWYNNILRKLKLCVLDPKALCVQFSIKTWAYMS